MELKNIRQKFPGWIDQKQAEKLLNLSYSGIYNLRVRGHISWSKIGGKVYFDLNSIMDLLEKNKKEALV